MQRAVKVSPTGSVRGNTGRQSRGEETYLLLDVAVGNRNGAAWSVEEVLVLGYLTRLHGTPRNTQLLHGEKRGSSQCTFKTLYIG